MNSIPERKDVKKEDKWDLSKLYPGDKEWEEGLVQLNEYIPGIEKFRGTLGSSSASLKACLEYMNEIELLDERLGYYAHLRLNEDEGSGENQERFARYMSIATNLAAATSWQTPEIQAIDSKKMEEFLADESLAEYRITLNKILRFKPHVLSENEEKLLAMQAEANQTANKTFSALTNVDMDFGTIKTKDGEVPLTQSTFAAFLINPDRKLREKAYFQFYKGFETHKNTIASLYAGSVHLDIYRSRVRNYESSRAAALFPDKVEEKVYDNLVDTIGKNLPALHKYYKLRRAALGLDKLAHYDVYAPLVSDVQVKHSYNEAVDVIIKALAPLGEEYCTTLKGGLTGGWVDRYENKGKRSGAFSAGSYVGDPYILINYKEDVLRDVFTLAHEGGHSMHSWYSVKNNPFQHYNYTIFEAEVASTFNEQLLAKYLLEHAEDDSMRAYLIGKQVDDIIATIFRQTMFAEFEHLAHRMVEEGQPLSVESVRKLYRSLLEKYFGSEVELFAESDLEGLRIPHFYRAFYVYKYSTGLAAAIALSTKVLNGDEQDRLDYLGFLKSGGSKYPLESLAAAGVDMSTPEPVEAAMRRFAELTSELEKLLVKA
ncbi:MAG: oligoendopeptidase F [Spirochaetales bacterium]|uniref:Oligopeptidase F n=1 Tax=Candidatus Thalassospirochaeta sargassi TaxID=3119039 RepID=A0AAJ1MJS0_9SPIO|nr:oligoendopeptidase F [Spirochaetales bacterium]